MEISQEAKSELKQIYFEETGKKLTPQEVEVMAQDLFYLFDAIYHPIVKDK